jgi:hypothetical protein
MRQIGVNVMGEDFPEMDVSALHLISKGKFGLSSRAVVQPVRYSIRGINILVALASGHYRSGWMHTLRTVTLGKLDFISL